jgi:hypothetical protein
MPNIPLPLTLSISYSAFEAANPSTPKPGANLDADFLGVQSSIASIIASVGDVRRADGALNNGTVTPDSLSAATLALMSSATSWVLKGAWAGSTAYVPFNLVTWLGGAYLCVVAHTSAAISILNDVTSGKWAQLGSASNAHIPASGVGSAGQILYSAGADTYAWGAIPTQPSTFMATVNAQTTVAAAMTALGVTTAMQGLLASADKPALLGALAATPWTPTVAGINFGDAISGDDNLVTNPLFVMNARGYVSGTATAAGVYMHERWKAGASGCTYSFVASVPETTVTISAGSLQQVIPAPWVYGGSYILTWAGTAQARVNGGAYAASPISLSGLAAATAITIEFGAGTLVEAYLKRTNANAIPTPFPRRSPEMEKLLCGLFFRKLSPPAASLPFASGIVAVPGSTAYFAIPLPNGMFGAPVAVFSNIQCVFPNNAGLAVVDVTAIVVTGFLGASALLTCTLLSATSGGTFAMLYGKATTTPVLTLDSDL